MGADHLARLDQQFGQVLAFGMAVGQVGRAGLVRAGVAAGDKGHEQKRAHRINLKGVDPGDCVVLRKNKRRYERISAGGLA